MAAGASLLNLHPRLRPSLAAVLRSHPPLSLHHWRPQFSFSLLYLSPFPPLRSRRFSRPNHSPSANSRHHSSATSPLPSPAPATTSNADDNGGSGRSGAMSAPLPAFDSTQKIDVNPPKGTRDFPPEEMRLRNWLFNNFREVSKLFGFEEVDFPVLESEALFIRKAGEEIRDQLYCFEDRGNRRVALRPELTPSLARLVIQKGKSLSLPLKWFAVGQCWRYERMTRGRRREHYQWNMDIIGVPEVTAEAELISSIVTFFKRIGITASDVGFKVSSRKVLQEVLRCHSIPENLFGEVCIIIDKMEKIPMDEIKKELKSVGILEEAAEELLRVLSIKSLTKLEEVLGAAGEAVADLKQLFSLVEKFGYSEWIQFDASVVRGLAYYTGIVFEGFDREGNLRAICGGGRYDQLLSTFGGDEIPACGFGFGDAVIIELLKDKGLLPELSLEVENIVCSLDPHLQGAAAAAATILREKGKTVDLVLENKPLKWVFKRASRINARRLILVGSSEWQRGMVVVKILSSGEQYEIKLDELE
ncbi:histidine--tRNA ligase, chloroplastic/mitochondrial isoform X2 [Malania oleifera]|uniref:histidine--tRNA ligase, chloroplastic/mitochondrial isoform X2 n=1 Tax=Malania oleifera TaxID=397392 RepID=UPI0025ADAAA6|nr:histidine--tRNA ligase, chloroplastic/mitochondrial isoform X2 [Malania oleifera]XP_057983441.1 histidine--tRNA ligase, chloroplastic/mitochondrial isoform X2 [Malania oleifera]